MKKKTYKQIYIDNPCLYWPDKTVTILAIGSYSQTEANEMAKNVFEKQRIGHEEFKYCRILPYWRLYDDNEWKKIIKKQGF